MRFIATTHNLWGRHRWPEREPALRAFLRMRSTDLYAVQELRPATRSVIDEELADHDRVDDSFAGWAEEGNIWWDRRRFDYLEHGAEDIGLTAGTSRGLRRLFWVRLRPAGGFPNIVVATAHFCYPGNAQEIADHINPRIAQSQAVLSALSEIAEDGSPGLFMGDLNEAWHTLRVLRAGGLTDSFSALRLQPPPTCPVGPARFGDPAESDPTGDCAPRVIDFQLHRGPVRPLMCEVIDFFEGDLAPSDHRPVATAYALT